MLFKQIVGQQNIKNKLIKAVNDNRISHAQLFFGPEGSGKLALAIAYSQYINCKDKKADDSCGVCPSCVKYQKFAHPDLHFVFPKTTNKNHASKDTFKDFAKEWRELMQNNTYPTLEDWYEKIEVENKQGIINAEDCNEIIRTLGFKSYEAEYKVFIIWQADKMFHAAAPKLLKSLEEPPEKTLFILITEAVEDILPTILSRTQIIKIPKIDEASLRDTLFNKYENASFVDDIDKIVKLSIGSYSEAMKIIADIDEADIYQKKFREWMGSCLKKDITFLVDWVDKIAKEGREKQKKFLIYTLNLIRESFLYNYGVVNEKVLKKEKIEFISKFSKYITNKNIEKIASEFDNSVYYIERNANAKIVYMSLSLMMLKQFNSL